MGILNKIGKVIDVLLEEENENYDKGVEFEKYVAKLFNQKYFSIADWTRDLSGKHDIRVESDSNPDLTVRYLPTNEKISVECKFRSNLYKGKLRWTYGLKIEDYRLYSRENNIPTFIAIGLGGYPDDPERMFCIPLEEAKYPELYPSIYERYERNPRKQFFWKRGMLS
ncbi:hypothetical protein ANME2D_00453 [Candidatus Methanoperedens nitroreducens]|uniref:PD(D/E)XK endonuclease domain-containing protein n=1 Tax=Candidatus Methanoperedens nitratireducens TaxID=1392998 RepID=A0A062V7X1_9EURY|nr:hypothetical protein [Candidatus Methanoperedens nitroreducens]KCZ73387.1 hypothetical protein ANME2D_00453 [Candidatus Methanoperedens nitroreducens]MDJ1422662.1 hypothetical protein [Candidatus Methanoperedens sp.]